MIISIFLRSSAENDRYQSIISKYYHERVFIKLFQITLSSFTENKRVHITTTLHAENSISPSPNQPVRTTLVEPIHTTCTAAKLYKLQSVFLLTHHFSLPISTDHIPPIKRSKTHTQVAAKTKWPQLPSHARFSPIFFWPDVF